MGIEERMNSVEQNCSKRGAEMSAIKNDVDSLNSHLLRLEEEVWKAINKLKDTLTVTMVKQAYILGAAILLGNIVSWGLVLLAMFMES